MSDYLPSRMHIKNGAALRDFITDLESRGVIQYPFTFNYRLLIDEQSNQDKKFSLQIEYTDTHFKQGKPLEIGGPSQNHNDFLPANNTFGRLTNTRLIEGD